MEYCSLFHSTVTAGLLQANVFLWNIRILHTCVAQWYKSPCNSRWEMTVFSVGCGATKPWIPCISPEHFTVLTWLFPHAHTHTHTHTHTHSPSIFIYTKKYEFARYLLLVEYKFPRTRCFTGGPPPLSNPIQAECCCNKSKFLLLATSLA